METENNEVIYDIVVAEEEPRGYIANNNFSETKYLIDWRYFMKKLNNDLNDDDRSEEQHV